MTEPSRNAPCPCGSGKRYKHCHGASADAGSVVAAPVTPPAPPARFQALAAHRAGQLTRAEALYREALAQDPSDVDALHMLGVVQLQRLRYREALDLLWDAAERSGWSQREMRRNLGIVLGKLVTREANVRQAALLAEFVALTQARRASASAAVPLVTVALPAYNHARYVGEALASVAAQTYRNLELVVIDDGSTDGTPDAVRRALEGFPFPARFVARENRGAPATLNECAAMANGAYVAFLNSDDRYAPDRIEALVDEVARRGVPWGFTLVSGFGDAPHAPPAGADTAVDDILQRQRAFMGTQPHGFTFVEYNVAVSTGNLFVERGFFAALGGFRDFRYCHDWEFCLRACAEVEPAVVERPLYFYRRHATNTIAESKARADADADRIVGDMLAAAVDGRAPWMNGLAPQAPANRAVLLKIAFRAGQGAILPVATLRALAAAQRSASSGATAAAGAASGGGTGRTALVVLGMHRSGTSAMARVLNLCGAFMPEKVKPPKIGVNPKGFWEPEAVLELNVRVMRQLGGEWDRIDFPLPDEGEVVDEFVADARALVAEEYEGAEAIVIKDPRMCVLAPLWRRALAEAGYALACVVPVRHPLEVARSLHARGDMSVARGLELWLAYMKRVMAFADAHPATVFVTFPELLYDWRAVVSRISAVLRVPLDAGMRAAEIDRFLERSLRNQVAEGESIDALLPAATAAAVRALYAECLERCARDAGRGASLPAVAIADANAPAEFARDAQATLGFVLCIENNAIRDQALMFCASVRAFGGRHRNAPIAAFAPRAGLGVDAETKARLAELGVEYVDLPLNATCLDYAPANRVFAGAYAEAHMGTDFLAVVDSDTLWVDEPALPLDFDVAVRPVDSKGSASGGPGDRFEPYWTQMAALAGIPLDRLPYVRATIGHERIRVSYNAGLTVARRSLGVLGRCAALFSASLEAGLRPYRASGMNIYASTGEVGQAGSEFWGSSQTAMTLAIWASTDRVLHYPNTYNLPLHLIAADGDIDPRWCAAPPVHVHYHWMLGRRHHEVAMEVLARIGVPADRRAWIAARTPFAQD